MTKTKIYISGRVVKVKLKEFTIMEDNNNNNKQQQHGAIISFISITTLSLNSLGTLPLQPTVALPPISCQADLLELVLHIELLNQSSSWELPHLRLLSLKDPSVPPHFLHYTFWRPEKDHSHITLVLDDQKLNLASEMEVKESSCSSKLCCYHLLTRMNSGKEIPFFGDINIGFKKI